MLTVNIYLHTVCMEKLMPDSDVVPDRTLKEAANVSVAMDLFGRGWGANSGWEDVWREHVAVDVRSYFHAFPATDGLEAAIEFNRSLFIGFPDLKMSVEDVVAEGDTVIVRGRLNGIHSGNFLGTAGSGAEVDVPDITIFRMHNHKVVENRYFTDLLAVMTAIGAIPEMEQGL